MAARGIGKKETAEILALLKTSQYTVYHVSYLFDRYVNSIYDIAEVYGLNVELGELNQKELGFIITVIVEGPFTIYQLSEITGRFEEDIERIVKEHYLQAFIKEE